MAGRQAQAGRQANRQASQIADVSRSQREVSLGYTISCTVSLAAVVVLLPPWDCCQSRVEGDAGKPWTVLVAGNL